MKTRKKIDRHVSVLAAAFLLLSCSTTRDLEKSVNQTDFDDSGAKSLEEEEQRNEAELNGYYVQEELKVQDMENTVVFVDRPVYIPEQKDVPELERGFETGYDAVKESQKKATVKPENYKSGTFFYQYNENLVYEIYAQPFHLTDIVLERGETVKGPASAFFSEDESVWELTAAVSIDSETGEEVQHFFVKPAYSKLDSTLIIITDRRVYHLRVKSFADTHMAIVKFTYPEKRNVYAKKSVEKSRSVENDFIRISNPELLSFDYKMKYSMFKKPEFLPKRVYDDGQSTYIQVDEIVLQKKLPVLFNEKNEIENYSVKKNVFVVPRLVNKVTLRLGKQKVVIEKKKTSQKIAEKIAAEEEAQVGK